MKSFNFLELKSLKKNWSFCEGSVARKIELYKDVICITFYKERKNHRLYFHLSQKTPFIILSQRENSLKKSKDKPATLFFKSHFLNKVLKKITLEKEDRVASFHFSSGTLDVVLIPHKVNFILNHEGKSISFYKRQDLKKGKVPENLKERKVKEMIEEMEKVLFSSPKKEKIKKKEISKKEKLQKILKKIDQEIEKRTNPFEEVGVFLKTRGHMKVPSSQDIYVNKKKSLSWNIENFFNKSKKEKKKHQMLQERKKEIEKKIIHLEKSKKNEGFEKNRQILGKKKGHELSDGFFFYVGRNARENIDLLKKAKPWHLWFHLKDFPGSHGILARNKKDKISEKTLQEACLLVAQKSLKKRLKMMKGEKLECVMAEVRYVKPIKKDKLGRVRFTKGRTLRVILR